MILGLGSFTFGWSIGIDGQSPASPMTESELVDTTYKAGLSCLQLGDNLPLHNFSGERLEALRSALDSKGIRFEIGARKLTTDHLQRYISLSAFFKSPLLRFVVDSDDYEPDARTVISIIKDIIPLLEIQNLTLGIENHDRFKATELADIITKVNSTHVGVCLDCVNSMGAGEGLEHVVDVLAPFTVNLHIKDFTVERLPHKMGFIITGTPTGRGMISIDWLMKKLSTFNRCQSAVLEQWVPFEKNIELTVETEKVWAEQSIHYLKSLPYFTFGK